MTRRILLKLIVIAVALATLLLAVNSSTNAAPGATGLDRAIEVQQRNTDRLMAIKGVVGTAVTLTENGTPAVAVLLEQPGVGPLARTLEGVPVRPVVTGKIYALPKPDGKGGGGGGKGGGGGDTTTTNTDPTSKFDRPVPIGVSTGHPTITAGTIGCRVTDGSSVYALSNNHVYANQNLAKIGDPVIQPGTYDGGISTADDIGTLADFEPIDFSAGATNVIDAAIALTTTDDLGNATPSNGYGTPKSSTIPVDQFYFNMPVMKYGRTTGQTKGRIQYINVTVNVGYDNAVATFVGQIGIGGGGFSSGGDSGSLIVSAERGSNKGSAIGLLFAGGGGLTFANPIEPVLTRFGVTIDGN